MLGRATRLFVWVLLYPCKSHATEEAFIGGWIFDTYHNYAWLYIASSAVAAGAVLLSLNFMKLRPRLAAT